VIENPSVKDAITSEDVLGKDVIDSRGAFLGVSDKLYIHPKTLSVVGISVDKGFMRKGFLIGAGHIREVTEYAVFLTIEPSFRLKGMTVFGIEGGKIGTVKTVKLVPNTNTIQELVVKSSVKGLGTITVASEYLARMEHNVFLNITREKLVKLNSVKK
jgi:sporulation protein YlmC with PRC-barrel domain